MKQHIIKTLVGILGWQVRRLRKKNDFKVVAIAGSMGKTSTKFVIASLLEGSRRVQWQKGNYNHILIVPLVFFGQPIPSLYNPFAWLRVLISNQRQLHKKYPYDVVVVELGTDGPGQLAEFEAYLKCDITVVTAVSPEHMEFFDDLDAVAREELSVNTFSDELILNSDLIDPKYTKTLSAFTSFGLKNATYTIETSLRKVTINKGAKKWLTVTHNSSSRNAVYSLTVAAVVADKLGLTVDEITHSVSKIITPPGRMQILKGIKNSTIIDETYNASPDAVIAALDYVYEQTAPQKIVLLGNMNELGNYSKSEHERIGKYCDPKQLDYVITLGPDANQYLAPAAKQVGCNIKSFETPYEVGKFVKNIIEENALILAKGSQNKVYMEEALKILLASKQDESKLVRQSSDWLAKKRKNFDV